MRHQLRKVCIALEPLDTGHNMPQHPILPRIRTGNAMSDAPIPSFQLSPSPSCLSYLSNTPLIMRMSSIARHSVHLVDIPFDSVAAPSEAKAEGQSPAVIPGPIDLSVAITKITSGQKVYTTSKLPPIIPIPHKRWAPTLSPDAPHDPHSYFPMHLYK